MTENTTAMGRRDLVAHGVTTAAALVGLGALTRRGHGAADDDVIMTQLSRRAQAGLGLRNVREFGAVGDGHTDDAPAIQRAIDALPQTPQEGLGGFVYLPPGEYGIGSTVRLHAAGIRFGGFVGGMLTRMGTTTLRALPGCRGPLLRIDIRAGDKGAWVQHLRLNGAGHCAVTAGVEYADGTVSVAHLSDVAIANCPVGILTGRNVQSIVWERVLAYTGLETGIEFGPDNRHITCRSSRVGGSTRAVLIGADNHVPGDRCDHIVFDDCELYGSGTGPRDVVLVRNATSVRLRDCWIEADPSVTEVLDALVVLGTHTASPNGTLVTGCDIIGNEHADHGIHIRSAVRPNILLNTFQSLNLRDVKNTTYESLGIVLGAEVTDVAGLLLAFGEGHLSDPPWHTPLAVERPAGSDVLQGFASGEAYPRFAVRNGDGVRMGDGSGPPVPVLGPRRSGWGRPSGRTNRAGFSTGSVSVSQLAERLKALIDDLRAHGLIGD